MSKQKLTLCVFLTTLSDQVSWGPQKTDGIQGLCCCYSSSTLKILFKAVRKGEYFPNRNQSWMACGRSKEQMMGFAPSSGKRHIKPCRVVKRSYHTFSPEICPMLQKHWVKFWAKQISFTECTKPVLSQGSRWPTAIRGQQVSNTCIDGSLSDTGCPSLQNLLGKTRQKVFTLRKKKDLLKEALLAKYLATGSTATCHPMPGIKVL